MQPIKTLEDLEKTRAAALEKRNNKIKSGAVQIIVGMGTCGIAVGALDTMKTISKFIESNNLKNIFVTPTGCIGACNQEPIVQIIYGQQQKVSYGKVSPEIANVIMKEHVVNGKILEKHIISI